MKQNAYYQGPASRYQVINGKRERPLDSSVIKYNKRQNFLYRRALLGLKVYSPDVKAKLHPKEKARIQHTRKRAMTEINIYKQRKMVELSNGILRQLFGHDMGGASSLLSSACCKSDKGYHVKLSNKQLGITKDDIISVLVEKKVLPKNFYELNIE